MCKIRDEFKRVVIEKIHGLPYKEAVQREPRISKKDSIGTFFKTRPHPITIGRVMQALNEAELMYGFGNVTHNSRDNDGMRFVFTSQDDTYLEMNWILTNEDRSECDSEDQTIETITSLLKILKDV